MPRGDKSAYTDKQKREAEHIEDSYRQKGVSAKTAAKRAWATVNKESGGGRKSGSGRKTAAKKTVAKRAGAKKVGARKVAKKSAAKKAASRRSG